MNLKLTNLKNAILAIIVGFLMISSFNFSLAPTVYRADTGTGEISDIDVTISDGKLTMTGDMGTQNAGEAMTGLIGKYKTVIVCLSGFGAVTMIAFFIMNFLKLGAVATNPSERAKVLTGLVWSGISAAGLGAVSILVGFFYYAMR